MTPKPALTQPALVVDIDDAFIETTHGDQKPQKKNLAVFASSFTGAQNVLADRDQLLSGVFINPQIGSPSWLHVVKAAHLNRPGLPIFLISAVPSSLTSHDLKRLGIQEALDKPIKRSELLKLLSEAKTAFHTHALSELSRKSKDTIGVASQSQASDFVPINAGNLLTSTKSLFDIYVQLSPRKFVKILSFGDSLSHERVLSYMQKGVTHFFLKRQAQEHYLSYCDLVASRVLAHPTLSAKVKASQTLNHGEQTIRFLESHGVNQTSMSYAKSYVDKVHTLVTDMSENNGFIQAFMKNAALYDHSASAAIVAGLLVDKIGLESKPIFEASGLAVLFHDVALFDAPENVRAEDVSKMSKEELEEFYLHPARGAKILSEMTGLHEAVVQAVRQHHMRLNGLGFPRRNLHEKMNRLAELIGVSDEFVRLIARSQTNQKVDPIYEMDHAVLHGFSQAVGRVFRCVFMLAKGGHHG